MKNEFSVLSKMVARKPIATFYYTGNHTHPVRRVVAVIAETKTHLIAYELREGLTVRTPRQAIRAIKTYRKERIAKWGDYCRLTATKKNCTRRRMDSTLERMSLTEYQATT